MLGDINQTITDLRNYEKTNLDRGFYLLFQGLTYLHEVEEAKEAEFENGNSLP